MVLTLGWPRIDLSGDLALTFEDRVIAQLASLERSLAALEQRVAAIESHQAAEPPSPLPDSAGNAFPSREQHAPTHDAALSLDEKRELLSRMLRGRDEPQAAVAPVLSHPHSVTPEPRSPEPLPAVERSLPAEPPPIAEPPPFVWSVRDEEPAVTSASAQSASRTQQRSPVPQLPPPGVTRKSGPSLESRIGGRWFAVAGAIAVLIALVLFLKLAYSQGWLGRVSPTYRCLTGGVFGLLLLASGELARRKINAWAAVGLFSSGVAGLYASVLAAHGMYDLLSNGAAFLLLAAVSGVGIVTGARTRLPIVSIVSVLGAYLAPILLDAPDPNPYVFPLYMLAVLATGLWLAAWLRTRFRVVGAVVWWGTLILGGVWALDQREPTAAIAIAFLVLSWMMVHASHVVAARTSRVAEESAQPTAWRAFIPRHQMLMFASSFSSSVWAATLCVWLASRTGVVPTWLVPFVLAGMCAGVAFALIPSWSLLREIPRTARERLGVALLAQAGALVIAGTAQATVGISAVPVWCALGLAAIVAGRMIRARALDDYGVVALGIGTLRYFAHDCWRNNLFEPLSRPWGLVVSEALGWGLGIGAAWVGAAALLLWRLGGPSKSRPRPLACAVMGAALLTLMAGVAHPRSEATSVTIVWAALAVLGVLLGNVGRRVMLTELSLGVLAVASAKALLGDSTGVLGDGQRGAHWAGLVFSSWMAVCIALAATCVVTALIVPGRVARRDDHATWGDWIGRGAAALAATFAMVAALHPDALGASIAVYWLMLGVVLILLAPRRPRLLLEAIGLIVLASALARLAVFDALQGLPTDGIAWHGLFLTRWCMAMALGGAAWLLTSVVLSFRTGGSRVDAPMPAVAGAASMLMFGLSVVHPQAAGTAVLWVWIALSWSAFLVSPLRKALKLDWSAAGGALASGLLWMVVYVLPDRNWSGSSYNLLLHPGLWSALLIAGLFMAVAVRGLLSLPELYRMVVRNTAVCLAIVLAWAGTSFEAARVGAAITGEQTVQLAFVSIWWAICAVALIIAGFKANVGAARRAGLALMTVAMLKVVFIDMGGVPQVWRIASFLLLGLLMIGVAMGYSRVAIRWLPRERE